MTKDCGDDCVARRMVSLIALGDMGQTRWDRTVKHEQMLHEKIEQAWKKRMLSIRIVAAMPEMIS